MLQIPKLADINSEKARESSCSAPAICFQHRDHRDKMFDQP